jgi:NTE family protein
MAVLSSDARSQATSPYGDPVNAEVGRPALDGLCSAPAQGTGVKRLNLALQGGGAHGAFTWGVLDRLLEESDLEIVGISGASAGAVNGVLAAYGLAVGGREAARKGLTAFWHRLADEARWTQLTTTPIQQFAGLGNAGSTAGQIWLEGVSRIVSPYDVVSWTPNRLADLLGEAVDFELLRKRTAVRLFVSATNVRTGKLRLFGSAEMSRDAVLASACLPHLFKAVEIDGEHYWDGGFVSNPPVLPLIEGTDCSDIMIIQVDPVQIEQLPTTAQAIRERVQVLAFNAGFMREMREVATRGTVRLHLIEAEPEMAQLGAASKIDLSKGSLERLFALGRLRANQFLEGNGSDIGHRSSFDVAARFL